MPILNYDQKFTDMPDMDKKQRCDICGVEEKGWNLCFSYYPAVSVRCKKHLGGRYTVERIIVILQIVGRKHYQHRIDVSFAWELAGIMTDPMPLGERKHV